MRTPIDRGLTAPPAYTPFGGYARLDRLVKSLDSADRRSAAWAVLLWAASVGTVTAQLLYEIGGPLYPNPDVTARFDTIQVAQEGPDRVLVSGAHLPSPAVGHVRAAGSGFEWLAAVWEWTE